MTIQLEQTAEKLAQAEKYSRASIIRKIVYPNLKSENRIFETLNSYRNLGPVPGVNPPPTASQAFGHADGLLVWLESLASSDPLHLTVVRCLTDQAGSHRTRQTGIRNFFQ